MLEIVILFFIALVLYFDLKLRIIPDTVNFFFMFLGIALVILSYDFEMNFLLYVYAPFFLLNFVFAYLLYKVGVWAGGDVKFFTALMAYLPLYAPFNLYATVSVFLASAALLIPITLIYNFGDIFLFRRDFRRISIESIIAAAKSTVISFSAIFILSQIYSNYASPLLILLFILATFFIRIPLKIALPIMLVGFLFFRLNDYLFLLILLFSASLALHFMQRSFGVISRNILTKITLVRDLREGMIPAHTYYLEKGKLKQWSPLESLWKALNIMRLKRISPAAAIKLLQPSKNIIVDALKARGVSMEEIKALKRLRVKEILIKESLPFAPVIAAAFMLYKYMDLAGLVGVK